MKLSKLLLTGLALVLSGCASLAPRDHEYNWYKSNRPVLPMQLVVVDLYPEEVKELCGFSTLLHACAVFYVKDKSAEKWEYTKCIVYTTHPSLPQFLIDHEKKHCDGWDHTRR